MGNRNRDIGRPSAAFDRQPAEAHRSALVEQRLRSYGTLVGSPRQRPPTQLRRQPSMALAILLTPAGQAVLTLSCDAEVGPVVIGRGAGAHLRLDDASVSRVHARLDWDPALGLHVLTDQHSANGTMVDGQPVTQPTPLYDGARLRIGQTELCYRRR